MSPVTKDRKAFWTTEKKRKYENAMSLLIRQIEIINKEISIKQGSHIIMVEEMIEEKGFKK